MIVAAPSIDADIVQDGTTLRLGANVGRTSAVEIGGTLTPTTFPGDVEIVGEGGGDGGGAGLGPRKVYLIAGGGQSNLRGWSLHDLSTDAARLYPPVDRIWTWDCWSGDPYYNRRSLLVEPRQRLDRTGAVSGQTGYGLCPGAARALLPELQANEEILIVDSGVGDTGALESSDWLAPSGTLLANWIARINAALASDAACELWGFVWMQGERDVVLQRRAGNYAAALDAIVTAVRSGVTGASNVPFIICGMVPAWRAAPNTSSYSLSTTTADVLEVHLSHTSAPYRAGMERVAFVDGPSGSTAHNPGDPVHYRASAQQTHGASIVAARSTALANTTISAPGTPSVSVAPLTATTARVTIVPAGSTHGYFELDWQNNGAGSWTSVSNTGAVLVRDITGLTAGTKNLRCRAGNRGGVSSYATTSWTQIELPSAPALSYTDVTGSSVDLEWTSSTGGTITGYEGRYRLSGGGAWTTFNPGNVLSYTLSGLTSGLTYEIEVRGVNANGPGPYSNTVTPTTGSAPTISSAGLGLPAASWTAHHVIYSLSGGSAGALVFEERALGSSGAWNPVTPTSADNAGAILPVDPTADKEIRITGANTVTLTWTGMARPAHILDFANSTHSASSPFEMSSVPNLGSNGTAWTNTGANANRALYDATTFSGIPVAACSIDRRLFGPALPTGKWWTMVLIYKVNDLGYGNMVSQNASSAIWLNGLGVANSRNLWYGDASPWNQVGPSSPGLTLNAWNTVTYVFDPAGGSNNLKAYINDTLALQGTRSERSQAGSGQIMNGFDTGSGPISSAGMQAYYAWVVQGQGYTVNATQISQLRQALLRERGLA